MWKNLREQFLEVSNFESAWQEVAFNQGCAGVDGETISHFLGHEEEYLTQLIAAILLENIVRCRCWRISSDAAAAIFYS